MRRLNFSEFIGELRRRNVYRAAVAYAMVAWLLTQVATQVFPFFDIPNAAVRILIVALLLGFPIAMLLASAYEFTPAGIVRTGDLAPTQANSARRVTGRVLDFVIIGVLILVITMLMFERRSFQANNSGAARKGIAVLPFQNLSADPENAYFAGGIQDDVLTNLAKIGDLKVISRTSVMPYANKQQNVREISKALGVTTVLEGSVRRVANRVLVSVQLIDAVKDEHIWADTFERDLSDVFAIQRDLALEIASTLQARLSANEKQRLEARPTQNGGAYLLYLRAQDGFARAQSLDDIDNVAALYERAVELDPSFALAFARLSYAFSTRYHDTRTPAVLEKARLTAREAIRLQSGLPEAHAALGYIYYWGEGNYQRALAEFAIARSGLPNDSEIFAAVAAIERRQGKWSESTADFEKCAALTPKDAFAWLNVATNYYALRDFPTAARILEHGIEVDPKFWTNRGARAFLEIDWKGDLSLLDSLVSGLPENFDPDGQVTIARLQLKLLQRRYEEAVGVVSNSSRDSFTGWVFPMTYSKAVLLGHLYRYMNDKERARAFLHEAQQIAVRSVAENPLDAPRHAILGQIYAALEQKDEAIGEGQRAVELLPESKDAFDGPMMILALAQVYAMLGQADSALPLLQHLLLTPRGVTVPMLQLDPVWDALRGDPRFQRLIEVKK